MLKTMRINAILGIALAIAAGWDSAASAAPITILSSGSATGAFARDGAGTSAFQYTNGNPAIDGVTRSATIGGSSASIDLSFTDGGNTAVIGAVTSQTREGGVGSISQLSIGDGTTANSLRFTADVSASYAFAGFLTGSGGAGGQLSVVARLWDITAGNVQLFLQNTDAYQNPAGNIVIGVPGGDLLGTFIGSPTGNLIAGHEYSLTMRYRDEAVGPADGGYSATGSFAFTVTADVPEPETALILALGLGAILLRRGLRPA